MKTQKEYNVTRTELSDGTIYFIGNDYIVIRDSLISCKRNKLISVEVENITDFKKRLDYIVDNDLTIIL